MLLDWFGRLRRSKIKAGSPEGHGFACSAQDRKTSPVEVPGADDVHSFPSFFAHTNGIFNQPTMIDMNRAQIIQHITNATTVLDRLLPYIDVHAAVDSSARDPPPRCHPGTRLKLNAKLEAWLDDHARPWNMIWLHGPAGTGKSAVVQTFAERCVEKDRLGAAFFFSRPNNRNDSKRLIPTLAYQLAVFSPEYKAILTERVANDPAILQKTPRAQLKTLIIEPFSILQMRGHPSVREPLLIALDGLDECNGVDAQRDIIEMIGEVVRVKKNLPLLWLICSRPEEHLKSTFSGTDFKIECSREALHIDADSKDDVDRYLRDGFTVMKVRYLDISASWPPKEQFNKLSHAASGLFIFASTALNYIGDSAFANPTTRLDILLSILARTVMVGVANPLMALDILYGRILADVSNEVLPVTWRILSHAIYIPRNVLSSDVKPTSTAQTLCNFLNISQHAFYSSLRKLHSVIEIPIPDMASMSPLRFYHTSFVEYLCEASRSGRFVIERERALVDIAKSCLFWCKIDTSLFHNVDSSSSLKRSRSHEHGAFPDLTWVSPNNAEDISKTIATFSSEYCWMFCRLTGKRDADLLRQIQEFDFRHILPSRRGGFLEFVAWLYGQDPSSAILRTQPTSQVDSQSLEHLNVMISREYLQPVTFPINLTVRGSVRIRYYFFIGHGLKSCIICVSGHEGHRRIDMLNSNEKPDGKDITRYRDWLNRVGWCKIGDGVSAQDVLVQRSE